jgi:hypothetical protein
MRTVRIPLMGGVFLCTVEGIGIALAFTSFFQHALREQVSSMAYWTTQSKNYHLGVKRRCVKPLFSENPLNVRESNGLLLSVSMTFGNPKVAINLSKTGMVALVEVDVMLLTTGNREYSSITTNGFSSVESGPPKSKLRFSQGQDSIYVICRGSKCFCLSMALWHSSHCFSQASKSYHVLAHKKALVWFNPWCPSWAILTTCHLCDIGRTIHPFRRRTLSESSQTLCRDCSCSTLTSITWYLI